MTVLVRSFTLVDPLPTVTIDVKWGWVSSVFPEVQIDLPRTPTPHRQIQDFISVGRLLIPTTVVSAVNFTVVLLVWASPGVEQWTQHISLWDACAQCRWKKGEVRVYHFCFITRCKI